MFVLFCSEEVNELGNTSRFLDLRILSSNFATMGGSWCVRSGVDHRKQVNRADCTKFLELRAKFYIAAATLRGVDEVELAESSQDELALAISLDETLRNNLAAVTPTLLPKMARDLIAGLSVNHSGILFEEMPDWPERNMEIAPAREPAPQPPPVSERITTKTQRVPV